MHHGGKSFFLSRARTPWGSFQSSYTQLLYFSFFSGHCKSLAPEYAKAAKAMAEWNPPQYLAKVDATEHKEVAGRFDVKGFPTLKFFR